ncbi:hypothetical protein Anapl_11952 [Anas platyrhynchos]|uniref:Uncharacterized protein n=1 Tax=Anas platyrhynchos TaxID=8839 RepID=R0LXP5_ANAPL|nr:hypothetical protein Anapl_11952 [Anas platyrhynchos]
MMLPAPNTQGKGGGGFHSACALPSPSTGAGEDQPSPAARTRPPTAFSSEAAGDDSRGEKGRKESAGDVQEEMAEGTPTFTQRQERGVTGKATVHVVVAAAGRADTEKREDPALCSKQGGSTLSSKHKNAPCTHLSGKLILPLCWQQTCTISTWDSFGEKAALKSGVELQPALRSPDVARSCREYNKRRLLLSEHSLVLDLRMAFKSLVQTENAESFSAERKMLKKFMVTVTKLYGKARTGKNSSCLLRSSKRSERQQSNNQVP